jgi:hypothetical protein
MTDDVALFGLSFQQDYFICLIIMLAILMAAFLFTYKRHIRITRKDVGWIIRGVFLYMFISSTLFVFSMPISILLKVGIALILIYYLRKYYLGLGRNILLDDFKYQLNVGFLLLFLGVLVTSYLSLIWGYGFVPDWRVHRTKLLALYDNPLEPRIDYASLPVNEVGNRLTYYYALFLPSAYVAKFTSYVSEIRNIKDITYVLSIGVFIWCLIGVILVYSLLPLVCKRLFNIDSEIKWGVFYLTLISFSGLNYWHKLVFTQKWYVGHAEWSVPYFAQYSGFLSIWQWSPFHITAGLIGIVVFGLYWKNIERFPLVLWSAFLVSSSVFCYIGMLPIVLLRILKWFKGNIRLFRLRWEFFFAIIVTFIIFSFYLTKLYPEEISINRSLQSEDTMVKYFMFLFVDLSILILILVLSYFNKIPVPCVIWLSILFLVLLPLVEMGRYNDLVLRGSVPALILLAFYSGYVIETAMSKGSLKCRFLVLLFFALTIPAALNEYIMGLLANSALLLEGVKLRLYLGVDDIIYVLFEKVAELLQ